MDEKIKIAMADDHTLLRNGLVSIINSFKEYHVTIEAGSGQELIDKMSKEDIKDIPAIVILDLNMPKLDGMDTAKWIRSNHPSVRILVLTMYDDDKMMAEAFDAGVSGYLLKDSRPVDLKLALGHIVKGKRYFSDEHKDRIIKFLLKNKNDGTDNAGKIWNAFSAIEKEFIRLSTEDITYGEMAKKLKLSSSTLEMMRQSVFTKLNVNSRVGIAVWAVKNNLLE
jgi:DNA-binding NarL/FixJ family response regulator